MRKCPPLLLGSARAACFFGGSLLLGSARAACFFGGSLLLAMAPVSTRGLFSPSTWVCRDQALDCARRGGGERSAVVVSAFKIAAASAAGAAAGCALVPAKAEPAPPNRLPNRSQPPPLAGSLLGSWLRAVCGGADADGADVVVPSPQGDAAGLLGRSLARVSLHRAAVAISPPCWLRPAS